MAAATLAKPLSFLYHKISFPSFVSAQGQPPGHRDIIYFNFEVGELQWIAQGEWVCPKRRPSWSNLRPASLTKSHFYFLVVDSGLLYRRVMALQLWGGGTGVDCTE